jgi:hypothetical protein
LEKCQLDYCTSMNEDESKKSKVVELALCSSFAAAAAECLSHSISVEWRKADRCRNLKI